MDAYMFIGIMDFDHFTNNIFLYEATQKKWSEEILRNDSQ